MPSASQQSTASQSHQKENLDVPAEAIPADTPQHDLKKMLSVARGNLYTHIQRKKQLDKQLVNIESALYEFETSYLTQAPDTTSTYGAGPSFGNIVKGYDSYLKAPSASISALGDRKRGRPGGLMQDVRIEDRLFSTSSATYVNALQLNEQRDPDPVTEDSEPEVVSRNNKKRRH